MPFGRRRGSFAPLKTDKHEITWSNLAQNASAVQAIALAEGVTAADKNISSEVLIGSKITRVYLEFHFSAETVTNPKVIHWKVEKLGANETTTSPATYYQPGRNRILQRGMEMLPKDVSTVFKRIISVKIPRGYQRMGEGETLRFRYISSSTETINACGIAIYKEIK